MANQILYVDSVGGSGTSPYDTWAKAATTMAAAIVASATTGNDFYVDFHHAETQASIMSLSFKGVVATPDRVFSVDKTGSVPPVRADLHTGAQITTTGANGMNLSGGHVYFYGVTLNIGSGAASAALTVSSGTEFTFENSAINLLGTGSTNSLSSLGAASTMSRLTLINTPITFKGIAGSGISLTGGGYFEWRNTPSALGAGSTAINNMFLGIGRPAVVILDGVDFGGMASGASVFAAQASNVAVQMKNCTAPPSATVARPTIPGAFIDQVICDNSGGSATYKQQRDIYQGTLTSDTAVYNSGSDGTTPASWKVITTANCNPQNPFECFEEIIEVPAGTYANAGIMITSANAALTMADVWVEAEYQGSSFPRSLLATSFDVGSGSSNVPQIPQGSTPGALGAGTWAVGGLGHNYMLALPSFSTNAGGYVRIKVKVGKPSLTLNIDPAPQGLT